MTLRRVEACAERLEALALPVSAAPAPDFTGLADAPAGAWSAPGVTMRARQQLLRALVTDIIVDVDEVSREVILTIHWRGGAHSQLRVRKPKTGEHGRRTPEEALAVMARMAGRWSDADIAASRTPAGDAIMFDREPAGGAKGPPCRLRPRHSAAGHW